MPKNIILVITKCSLYKKYVDKSDDIEIDMMSGFLVNWVIR